MTLYPLGYSAQMVTMDELRAIHEPHMHPEYARRLFAYLEYRGGHLGIGGGYRPPGTQPDQPGYAPPGKSFHEGQQFASGITAYCAVDLVVPVPGQVHRAPTWDEVPDQGSPESQTWGLHANVSGEPWHLQPTPIDGFDGWVSAGRKDPQAGYPIPGGDTPTPTPPPAGSTFTVTLPTLEQGDTGEHVETLQFLMSARGVWSDSPQNHDGVFGAGTAQYVRTFQTSRGLTADAVVGPLTWGELLKP